ncbi:hypothetical protein ACQ86N_34955 [Puia sp. P3]|uniref:hypothetical protein n=1 Tax=Puia sp. P3 TaxID=3423952 RepID=UPI003D67158F
MSEPGGWGVYMYMQGETVPKETNTVSLSKTEKDQWGIPSSLPTSATTTTTNYSSKTF